MSWNQSGRNRSHSPTFFVAGFLLLTSLTGCAASKTGQQASQPTNALTDQTAAPLPAPAGLTPAQIAQQNTDNAIQACNNAYPFKRGEMYKRYLCSAKANEKYINPLNTDHIKAIGSEYWNNLLAAAKQFDHGQMSSADFQNYTQLCWKILNAKENMQPNTSYEGPDKPSMLGNLYNFDLQHYGPEGAASDERQIALVELYNQKLNVFNDKYEYEYCAGLHSQNLSQCNLQKISFQTDLAVYQSMAAAVPSAPQPISQPAQDPMQNAIDEGLLAGMAGGVVP